MTRPIDPKLKAAAIELELWVQKHRRLGLPALCGMLTSYGAELAVEHAIVARERFLWLAGTFFDEWKAKAQAKGVA